MKKANWKKPGWMLAGILFLGLIAALFAAGAAALEGNKPQPSASGSGPAISWMFDGDQPNPGSPQPSIGPDRITLAGKIDSLDSFGFQLLQGPRYKSTDKVIVSIDQNTKIVDATGQPLKLADLKQGQEVTLETDPVMTMIYPTQVKGYSVKVLG